MQNVYRWISLISLSIAGGIAGIMLLLRVPGAVDPLIYDEVYSWITADPAHCFSQVWEVLRADVNLPLFNILLRGWAHLVPMTPGWMRVIPVTCSIATPLCAWFLAPKSWTKAQKLVFCVLLGASYSLTVYSALLRTYSLAVLGVCVVSLLALQIVQALITGKAVCASKWIVFGLTGVLTCYCHFFAAALFFITAVFVAGFSLYYKKQRAWAIGIIIVVGAVWLLWTGPIFYALWFGENGGIGHGWWFTRDRMLASWEILEFLIGTNPVKLGVLGFVIVSMTSFLFEQRPLFTGRPEIWLAWIQIIGLSLAVWVVSRWCNLMINRYFLVLVPSIALLLTGLLMHLQARWKWIMVVLPVFALMNFGHYIQTYQRNFSDPTGLFEIFSYVTHQLHREEVLVVYDRVISYPGISSTWMLEYFLPKDKPLTLTPLTRENVSRMQAPEEIPLVVPLSAFTFTMKFSEKYGFDARSNLRQFRQTCLVRTHLHS